MVRARLGLDPRDVLHQGIAGHLGVPIGWVAIAVSGLVLLAWIPQRRRPGSGPVGNGVVVHFAVNAALGLTLSPADLVVRAAMLSAAILINGVSTACNIGAGLGSGARDGLMTGIRARGHSLRTVRTGIETSALGMEVALGGSVGVGTGGC